MEQICFLLQMMLENLFDITTGRTARHPIPIVGYPFIDVISKLMDKGDLVEESKRP